MRTTLSIHDSLLKRAKQVSLERNISLGEVVEEALLATLNTVAKRKRNSVRPIKTYRGDGVQPGVDLTSAAALLDAMEGR